jgi:hypothetical protein
MLPGHKALEVDGWLGEGRFQGRGKRSFEEVVEESGAAIIMLEYPRSFGRKQKTKCKHKMLIAIFTNLLTDGAAASPAFPT